VRKVAVMQGLYSLLERQRGEDTDDDHQVFAPELFESLCFGDFEMHGKAT
jgi:hypothetical protein